MECSRLILFGSAKTGCTSQKGLSRWTGHFNYIWWIFRLRNRKIQRQRASSRVALRLMGQTPASLCVELVQGGLRHELHRTLLTLVSTTPVPPASQITMRGSHCWTRVLCGTHNGDAKRCILATQFSESHPPAQEPLNAGLLSRRFGQQPLKANSAPWPIKVGKHKEGVHEARLKVLLEPKWLHN